MAWRLFGAFNARITTLRVSKKVLPLRDPPNSMQWRASPARTFCAAFWRSVSSKVLIILAGNDANRAAILASVLSAS